MAYNEQLAQRIRKILGKKRGITEKKMFGGLCFLLKGKMCCGILKDDMVARVNPDESDALLQKNLVRPMDFTGRPMKGFLYVSQKAVQTASKLNQWVQQCIDFTDKLPTKKK